MAFTVNLYSFTKAPNSTKQPTGTGTAYQCVSNDDFNVISPRVPLQIGAAANPASYNYAKITSFNRYYWIRSWAWENGLWVAYMEVDALASWKTGIGSMSAYVLRSAAAWNGKIQDNKYPTDAEPVISKKSITTPWNTTDALTYSMGFFVVGIIGGASSTVYYAMTASQYASFISKIFDDTFFTGTIAAGTSIVKAQFNPIQYVTTVMWFPIPLDNGSVPSGIGTTSSIYLGYWDTGLTAVKISDMVYRTSTTVTIPRHPLALTRGTYLNVAPYAQYTLFMQPYGQLALDPLLIQNADDIGFKFRIDLVSGDAVLEIVARVAGVETHKLGLYQARLALSIQLSQVLTDYVGMATSVIGGVAGAVGSFLAGNIAGGIAGAVSAIGNTVSGAMPDVSSTGMNSGMGAIIGNWYLQARFLIPVADDLPDRGRPLCEVRTLSTLSGYQLCADVEVTISCTREEEQMIKTALETGYFYE